MTTQPDTGDRLLRLPDVLKILPIAKSSFYAGIASGRYPPPLKLGQRTSAWRYSDIMRVVQQ